MPPRNDIDPWCLADVPLSQDLSQLQVTSD